MLPLSAGRADVYGETCVPYTQDSYMELGRNVALTFAEYYRIKAKWNDTPVMFSVHFTDFQHEHEHERLQLRGHQAISIFKCRCCEWVNENNSLPIPRRRPSSTMLYMQVWFCTCSTAIAYSVVLVRLLGPHFYGVWCLLSTIILLLPYLSYNNEIYICTLVWIFIYIYELHILKQMKLNVVPLLYNPAKV